MNRKIFGGLSVAVAGSGVLWSSAPLILFAIYMLIWDTWIVAFFSKAEKGEQ